jgi:hypothetical protein
MKENPLPPPKPPNQKLLEHEIKRKKDAKIFTFKKSLPINLSAEEISKKVEEYKMSLENY